MQWIWLIQPEWTQEGGEEGWKAFLPISPTSGFSFVTSPNHNKVTRRSFIFTFYRKLIYILTYILT